jgi:DinB superfamily
LLYIDAQQKKTNFKEEKIMAKFIRALRNPRGYNLKTQRRVASFASQLDDQLVLLKTECDGLTTEQLEWQSRPGMNTIGMIVAHLAVVEVFWLVIAVHEIADEAQIDKISLKHIGIAMDDDGLPLKADGKHPQTLAGWTIEQYWKTLTSARKAVHKELRTWKDSDLSKTYKRKKYTISREWTVYHVLEHFAGHFGQVLLLKHMMRDAGVLESKSA